MWTSMRAAVCRAGAAIGVAALSLSAAAIGVAPAVAQTDGSAETQEGQTPPAAMTEQEIVDRISAYLNSIETMSGQFVQISPDGLISEGTFVMRRPGRILFRYEPPNPTRVIADGFWVAVVDETSTQPPDRYPLSETPLNLLLQADVDLAEENAIEQVERRDGKLRVTAIDPTGEAQGSITMVFNEDPITLHQWVVVDAQGLETSVVLRNVEHGVDVDMEDFSLSRYDPPLDDD